MTVMILSMCVLAACGGGADTGFPSVTLPAHAPPLPGSTSAAGLNTTATSTSAAPPVTIAAPLQPTASALDSTSADMASVIAESETTALIVAAAADTAVTTAAAATYLRTVHVNAAAGDDGNGSAATPYRTIAAALRTLRPGDDVVIAAGIYRESIVVPSIADSAPQTRIRAAAARAVTIKGSQEVAGWTAIAPQVYATPWAGDQPQQVFRAGSLLKQIGGTIFSGYPSTPSADLAGLHASEGGIWPARVQGGVAELTPDSFTFDQANRRVIVKLSSPLASDERLEISSRTHVLVAENARNLTIEGIDFAHSNTTLNLRWGAVKVVGKGITLVNLQVRDMDGTCVQIIGEDNVLRDSTIERCGQTGVSGHGRRLTIASNRVLHNNTRGFNKWWEAGGLKLIGNSGLHDSVVRGNVVAYNAGDGIWLDWKNTNILIEDNTTAYNAGFGIHYEASQAGTIRGNRAYGNTMRGIYLFESSSTSIEGNAVFGNAMEGIGVVDGGRSAVDPMLKPFDNRVFNNTIAWNDFDRNWIQLVLPGDVFRSASDNNAFKAERLPPRMSMAFMSPSNAPFERLEQWQSAKRHDLLSTTQTTPMPADLKAALDARRLLAPQQLPKTLATPGSY